FLPHAVGGDGGPLPSSAPITLCPGRKVVLNSHAQFQQQAAEGHTHIPVVREVLSDLDTPLSVYLKLADGPNTYLFESVEGGERFGRYSIIGLPARRVYAFHGHTLTVREDGQVVDTREVADPFAEVEALRSAH
ncbi:hypothetical protein J6396_42000, partial [Pseudomonas aeruginosa]|nr:hypothetical protein [Pseudomonas aeruginosa]